MRKFEIIPRVPYGVFNTPEKLRGLIAFFKRTGVKALQAVPISYPFEPAFLSRETLERRRDELKAIYRALKKAGIEGHLCVLRTFMPTFSHGAYTGFKQRRMDLYGKTQEITPCPLDADFRDYLRFMYERFAESGTRSIMIDDDFRYEHINGLGATCFCPLHIAEFNRRTGRAETFETLTATCRDAAFSELKEAWMTFKKESLEEIAVWLRDIVHGVNPDVRVGLMLTSLDISIPDLRDPRRLVEILAGPHRPLVRPGQGAYDDKQRTEPLEGLAMTAFQSFLMPPDTEIQAEVDSYPHSQFNKAAANTLGFQIKNNLALGLKKINLWPFDNRAVLNADHPFAAILKKNRRVFDAVVERTPETARARGVQPLYNLRTGLLRSQEIAVLREHMYGPYAPVLLWRYGISWTYEDSDTVILTKDSLPLDAAEFANILATRHCLLDVDAARSAVRLGLAAVEGLSVSDAPLDSHKKLMEIAVPHPASGAAAGLTARSHYIGAASLAASERFEPIGYFIGKDQERTFPSALVSNAGPKRLAVLAYPIHHKNAFWLDETAQARTRELLTWLNGAPLPATILGTPDICPTLLATPDGAKATLSLMNFSTAMAENFTANVCLGPAETLAVSYLDARGNARPFPASATRRDGRLLSLSFAGKMAIRPFDTQFVFIVQT